MIKRKLIIETGMVWSVSSNKWKAPKVMTSTQIDLKQQYPLGDVAPSKACAECPKPLPGGTIEMEGCL